MLHHILKPMAATALLATMLATPVMSAERLTIGTGPAGTLYHQIGTTLSSLYQEKTGAPGTARPFTGTTNYMPLIHRGDIEAGIHGGLESRDAFSGQNNFPEPMANLRALIVVSQPGFQFFTRAEDGLTSIDDLRGKNVVTRFRAIQGFDQVIDAILGTSSLGEGDVEATTVGGVIDGITSVQEGRVDAAVSALGIPPLRQADASISGGIRVLTLGPNEKAVTDVVGLFIRTTKPSPPMVGVMEPIRSVHFNTFVNVGVSMSDDDAYELAKIIHSNWAQVQEALPPLRGMQAANMVPDNLSHPFHNGAIRYFKEAGMWTDAHQAQQDALLN